MKKTYTILTLAAICGAMLLSSCSSKLAGIHSSRIIHYELGRNDMDISDQMTASAEAMTILCIDWARLFKKESGSMNSSGYGGVVEGGIPILGAFMNPTKVQNYALYNLIAKDSQYDFVVYPRFTQESNGFPCFCKTKATVTARLGKLK